MPCRSPTSRRSGARGRRRTRAPSKRPPGPRGPSTSRRSSTRPGRLAAQGGRAAPRLLALRGRGGRRDRHHRPVGPAVFWLPLAHVFGKAVIALCIGIGIPTAVDGRVDRLAENLAVVKPTFVGAVPRVFEKVHGKVSRRPSPRAGSRRRSSAGPSGSARRFGAAAGGAPARRLAVAPARARRPSRLPQGARQVRRKAPLLLLGERAARPRARASSSTRSACRSSKATA